MSASDERGILPAGGESVYWLVQSEQVWGASHAPHYLSAAEWAYCSALKSDKRRRDWLLGRHAAKEVVADLMHHRTGRRTTLDQIIILPHADGWPMVSLPDDNQPALTLSISHSHNYAFCAAVARPEYPLGADIEFVEPRSEAFIADYFTPREREFLAAAPPEQRAVLANAIWSGKEAALKAIRRGLAEDTRVVSCLPHPLMGDEDDWLPMPIIWNGDETAPARPALGGYWRMSGGFVLAIAVAGESV
mgnify:CR=1 FL=1